MSERYEYLPHALLRCRVRDIASGVEGELMAVVNENVSDSDLREHWVELAYVRGASGRESPRPSATSNPPTTGLGRTAGSEIGSPPGRAGRPRACGSHRARRQGSAAVAGYAFSVAAEFAGAPAAAVAAGGVQVDAGAAVALAGP